MAHGAKNAKLWRILLQFHFYVVKKKKNDKISYFKLWKIKKIVSNITLTNLYLYYVVYFVFYIHIYTFLQAMQHVIFFEIIAANFVIFFLDLMEKRNICQ